MTNPQAGFVIEYSSHFINIIKIQRLELIVVKVGCKSTCGLARIGVRFITGVKFRRDD